MNVALVQGRPTKDPELKRGLNSGKVFCTFTIACDRPYRGKNQPRETDFFKVIVFNKLAQTCYNNIAQGALITVFGRLENNSWIDRTGQRKWETSIKAQNVTIHEWLRKGRDPEDMDEEFDISALVPDEIHKSLFKQVDIDDEDIPNDLLGDSIDDYV